MSSSDLVFARAALAGRGDDESGDGSAAWRARSSRGSRDSRPSDALPAIEALAGADEGEGGGDARGSRDSRPSDARDTLSPLGASRIAFFGERPGDTGIGSMAHVAARRTTLAELLGIRSFSTRALRQDEQGGGGLPRILAKPGSSGALAADRRSTVPMTESGRDAPRGASAERAIALPPAVDRQQRYDGSRQQGSARALRLFEPHWQPQPATSAAGLGADIAGAVLESKEPE